MNILICDDKKDELERIADLINQAGFDTRLVSFLRAQEALEYICSGSQTDVCFLDIVMPEMNGITMAEKLRKSGYSGEIVFLTGSNDYASQSYKVKAFDYLLKPPTPKSVRDILGALEKARKNTDRKGITIKTHGTTYFIMFRDISHAEVTGHNVHLRLVNGEEVKVYTSFAEIVPELLSDRRFVQCHRSFIVNVSDIKTLSDRQIIMQRGEKIPISKGYSHVKETMMEWLFGGNK
jgi:DNA-binding LytR/AlgR family response regulator